MFSIDKIKKLTKQLFPTGRAFNYPIGGGLDKLMSSLAESEKRAIDDNYSILDQILPDNSNFSADDATKWENRLGMITVSGVSLTDRKEDSHTTICRMVYGLRVLMFMFMRMFRVHLF